MVPECFCAEGYELTQKRHCKAIGDNATLVVANENTLRHLDPYGLNYLVDVDEERSEGASKIQVCNVSLFESLKFVQCEPDRHLRIYSFHSP